MSHPFRRAAALTLLCAGLLVPATASQAGPAKGVKRTSSVKAFISLGGTERARASQQECENADIAPNGGNLDEVRAAILCLHNQIRAQNGLPLLKDNAKLRRAATGHSNDMVTQGFFDHTSPDGDSFVDRIIGAGYAKRNDGWTIGENLAWGTGELSTPQAIMNAWMNSAGHKANILKKAYKEVGISVRLGVPTDAGVGATVTADFGAKV